MPAATIFFAMWRAAYAAERSTLVGSLPEKAPPPVRGIAAVGVHNDLASGEARVCSGATLDETTCGIDEQGVGVGVHVGLVGSAARRGAA